jgi:hypothetical protein
MGHQRMNVGWAKLELCLRWNVSGSSTEALASPSGASVGSACSS